MLVHGHGQVHRAASHFGQHVGGVGKLQFKEAQQALEAPLVHVVAHVEVVERGAGLGVEPHVPHPVVVVDLFFGLDGHLNTQKVRHPFFEHAAQRLDDRLASVEAHGHILRFVALPVDIGVVVAQHVEVDTAQLGAVARQQLAQGAKAAADGVALHRFVVGRHHGAVFHHGDALGAKQHFGSAGFEWVRLRTQHVAQQHLGGLLHQHGRHINPLALEQRHVTGFERGLGQQTVAKAQPHGVVGSSVGVGQGLQLGLGNVLAGLFKQGFVQGPLGAAGVGNGRQFGPVEQMAQKVVGDVQLAVGQVAQPCNAAGGPVSVVGAIK